MSRPSPAPAAPAGLALPLRVAIIGTNDPSNFSGGRYHALIMAHALAAAGAEVHVVTNHLPAFRQDLEPLCPGGVRFSLTEDFAGNLPAGRFDYVVVIPTGVFHPEFYEACLDFAAAAQARIALVNFESANWFNQLAPVPRDPRLWDYWRRVCLGGALVLSSARESHRHAQAFYRAGSGPLRHEVWCPPINSVAARQAEGQAKDGSLIAFVRPQDLHKGSADLAGLDPMLLRGRVLRLVAGRDVPAEFRARIEAHAAAAPGAQVEFLTRIPDLEKFRLVAAAQAVLFPSRFEGFGYPPVEAAFAGTESVCFPLPVLQETVGQVAHFASAPDMAGFGRALAAALAMPERRATLRAAVAPFADFHRAAGLLADILLRSLERLEPLAPRTWRVAFGPWARVAPVAPEAVARAAPPAPLPPHALSAVRTSAGDVLVSGLCHLPRGCDGLQASATSGPDLTVIRESGTQADGGVETRFHLLAPAAIAGRRVDVMPLRAGRRAAEPIGLRVDRLEDADPALPVRCGLSEDAVQDGRRRIRGWVLARRPVTEIRLSPDGIRWFAAAVTGERRDVLGKFPGYPSPRAEFRLELPDGAAPDRRAARLLCLAEGKALDLLVGWPPAAGTAFEGGLPPVPEVAPDAAGPLRRALGMLDLQDVTDAHWQRGIARRGEPGRLAAIRVGREPALGTLQPGMVLGFASGDARRVVRVEAREDHAIIVLGGSLSPRGNGFPNRITVHAAADPELPLAGGTFQLSEHSDGSWWRGVWNLPGPRLRQGFLLRTDAAAGVGLATGVRLRFPASGVRTVTELRIAGDEARVFLDGAIRPLEDGAPREVAVLTPRQPPGSGTLAVLEGPPARGWSRGLRAAGLGAGRQGTWMLLGATAGAAEELRPGAALALADGGMARVARTAVGPDGLEVLVDAVLDPDRHGAPAAVQPLTEVDLPDGMTPPLRYPDPGYRSRDPLHLLLATEASRLGRAAALPPRQAPGARPRILLATLVPPAPANQGNRVVTRNLIRHLVALGFDVDVVMQGWIDAAEATATFGDRVRFFALPTPAWQECEAVRLRQGVAAAARTLATSPLEGAVAEALAREADNYHPYFIVRDETVAMARRLFAAHDYAGIVCNYTHMLRVAEELAALGPLPPVAVITHDALSCLPREVMGQKLDLTYRACTAGMERAVLDALPGCVVVAISRSEADYFARIGVTNPVVLCEYDGAEEMRPSAIPRSNFMRGTLVFQGSANPMNVASLDWFADQCWDAILAAVPEARLLVLGHIGTAWKHRLPNVEIVGELDRAAMRAACGTASIAINPCVAGTGLKIKTVEAACLGLPGVCLPAAVEGLEADAQRFAIVAEDGPGFARACIALLTDAGRWRALHEGALQVAKERFGSHTVYAALDAAMGWPAPPAAGAPPPGGAEAFPADAAPGLRALDDGEPWEAVLQAAVAVAQDPAGPAGYEVAGRGMLACGLREDAVACLTQGVLVAPRHPGLLEALAEALRRANRPEEAARWEARRPLVLRPGETLPLDGRHLPGSALRGWAVRPDGGLMLGDDAGELALELAEAGVAPLVLALDIALPAAPPAGARLLLRVNGQESACALAATPGVQTLSAPLRQDGGDPRRVTLALAWPPAAAGVPVQALALRVAPPPEG